MTSSPHDMIDFYKDIDAFLDAHINPTSNCKRISFMLDKAFHQADADDTLDPDKAAFFTDSGSPQEAAKCNLSSSLAGKETRTWRNLANQVYLSQATKREDLRYRGERGQERHTRPSFNTAGDQSNAQGKSQGAKTTFPMLLCHGVKGWLKWSLLSCVLWTVFYYVVEIVVKWFDVSGADVLALVGGMETLYRIQWVIRSAAVILNPVLGIIGSINPIPCVLPNPLFIQPGLNFSCSVCHNVSIMSAKSNTSGPIPHQLLGGVRPILFKKWGSPVTLENIQDQLSTNLQSLNVVYPVNFQSSVDYLTKIHDLASDQRVARLAEDPNVHLTWMSDHYMTSQILRKMFPRPAFIPLDMTVTLKKVLLVDGVKAPSYQLPLVGVSSAWYSQGAGSRTLVLSPRQECGTTCPTLTVKINATDILNFQPKLWNVHSQPRGNETSLAFMGHFGFQTM